MLGVLVFFKPGVVEIAINGDEVVGLGSCRTVVALPAVVCDLGHD